MWIYTENIAIFIDENEFLQDDGCGFLYDKVQIYLFKSLGNPAASWIMNLVSWLYEKNSSNICLHLNVLAMWMWVQWQLGLRWVTTQQNLNVNLWLESNNFNTRK